MNWQDVSKLRKAGQLEDAREVALGILAADPEDYKTKSQYEWVIFDCIKRVVAKIGESLKKSQPIDGKDANRVVSLWSEYRELNPRVPEMACSMIVGQVSKVGHLLPDYADIIYWLRRDGLREEDWRPNEYQGKLLPSLATKIALALCKWIKGHPDRATPEDLGMALEWIAQSREHSSADHQLWLDWNAAILLRQKGEPKQAAELLASVIKAKRNEFWVWAEAGRLYQPEQPELALACFCRALECPAEPKFLVRAHRELAELLVELEEFAQASREVATTIEIRQAEGWPIGREMEALIAKPWYDPSAEGAEDLKAFYGRHSSAALTLCFDAVETKAANYLGLLVPHPPKEPHPSWKPKPLFRFAIKDAKGRAWSQVGPGVRKLKFENGAPLTIVIGRQNGGDRETIVHVSARQEGEHWDCLEPGVGVVVREPNLEKSLKVFIAGSGEESGVDSVTDRSFRIGDGVRFGIARNPKNNRVEVFNVEPGELPEMDVKHIQGQLRRNPKGFAFVEDAFVAPQLVEFIGSDVEQVVAVAVYGKHPKEEKRTWRAISLRKRD